MIIATKVAEPTRSDAPPPRQASSWPYRYPLLDGLRGMAALAVVMHHVGIVSVGHYAVMVFFVISGYCITAAAESGRERGVTFSAFMWRRFQRIYPPYLLAMGLFAATRMAKSLLGGHQDLNRSAVEWLQNLTLTQWLSLMVHPQPWATQNPVLFVPAFWSLNYEEQFYLVMALCLTLSLRKRFSMLYPILLLMAIGLAFNAHRPGGWVCGFFLEYWAHFSLGALLFYALCKRPMPWFRTLFVVAALWLGGVLLWQLQPWEAVRADSERAYVELTFLIGVTLTLFVLRPWSGVLARSAVWKPLAALGTISYSLYLIHQFNLTLVSSLAAAMLPAGSPAILVEALILALHVALATLFWFFCERPFLNGVRAPSVPAAREERYDAG